MLKSADYIQRVGSLYEELKVNSRPALLFNAIFVLRRLIFALTAVFVTNGAF